MYQSAPHSSYTGALAESGLVGGFGLAAFVGGVALGIRDSLRKRDAARQMGLAAAAVFAVVLIEATATDVMHFRHYTWLAAWVGWAAARQS
jgi:O-antigen ligase